MTCHSSCGRCGNSHEAYDGCHLDDGKNELCLAVALDTTQVNGNYYGKEDGDEDCLVNMTVPVFDRDGGSYDFQRQYY